MSEARGPNVYAVSRSVWDHAAFLDEPFTQREAWLWLIGAAAWKDIKTRGNAGAISLKRGEFSFSVRFLAEKWKWSKSRVDRFLRALKNRDMVRDTKRDMCEVYLISNYNKFQIVGVPKRDSSGTADGTAAGQQRDKEETGETGETVSSLRSDTRARGARWPSEASVSEGWIEDASKRRSELGLPTIDMRYEAERFQNYWASKSGGSAIKLDWKKTWMNWATDREKTHNGKRNHAAEPRGSSTDQHLAGIGLLIEDIRAGRRSAGR